MPGFVLMSWNDGVIVWANPATATLFGWPVEELLGREVHGSGAAPAREADAPLALVVPDQALRLAIRMQLVRQRLRLGALGPESRLRHELLGEQRGSHDVEDVDQHGAGDGIVFEPRAAGGCGEDAGQYRQAVPIAELERQLANARHDQRIELDAGRVDRVED